MGVDMAMVDTASDTQDMVDTVWEVTEAMVDTAVPLEDMEESGDRPQTITISSSSINLIDYYFSKHSLSNKILMRKSFDLVPYFTLRLLSTFVHFKWFCLQFSFWALVLKQVCHLLLF